MKNLRKNLVQLIFIAASQVVVAVDTPKQDILRVLQHNSNIQSVLTKISYPQKVRVYFSVNQAGIVNDIITCTGNRILAQEINDQFKKLSFKDFKPGVMNSVDLNFIVY